MMCIIYEDGHVGNEGFVNYQGFLKVPKAGIKPG
jgi:hypothetical protein